MVLLLLLVILLLTIIIGRIRESRRSRGTYRPALMKTDKVHALNLV